MIILISFLFNINNPQLVTDYEIGHQLFLQENYKDAAAYFTAMLNKYSGSDFEDEIRFRIAECYFNLNDYRKAKKSFETILRKDKTSYLEPECIYALGLIEVIQNNFPAAEQILQKLLENPAYHAEARANFAQGGLYYFRGSYEEAKEKLAGINLLEAEFYYGKALAKLGKTLSALSAFKQIVDEAPNTPIAGLAYFSMAEAFFSGKDFDGAKIKFQEFILKYPESPLADYARYFLAASLIHGGEYVTASELLLPMTKHRDNLLAAHSNYLLGIGRMNLGDGLGAVSAFQRVRANYPNTQIAAYANLQLTHALLASGDTFQALISSSQLSTMFASSDFSSVGEYLTGVIYFQEADYINASKNFELLLQHCQNSKLREPAAALFLYALNNLQKFDQAITFGSKYIKDFPEDKTPWRGRTLYYLAEAYYYEGNFSQAEKIYLEVTKNYFGLEIIPYAKLGLAYAKYNQNRQTEALAIFNNLSQIIFDDSSLVIATYLGLGYTHYNQHEYPKSLDAFEKIHNTYPDDECAAVPALFYAGMCYYNLQYYLNAIESWEKLIGAFPLSNKSAEAGFRVGDTYFKAREYEKTRSILSWVVENHPSNDYASSAQLVIAQSYYNEKLFDEAIREFEKFLDLFPTAGEANAARQSIEMCYFQKGLGSTEAMQIFVEKFPQSELAADGQYEIAQKYFDEKNYVTALDEFLKVVVNFSNSAYAEDGLLLASECAISLENWQKAVELYQRYLNYFTKGKERDVVYFNLGTAYFNLTDYRSALRSFEIVVDSFPNSQYLNNARNNCAVCGRRLGEAGLNITPEALKVDSLKGRK